MKIILVNEIKNIGKKGEIKEVSDGYARNFLFPKKLAKPATAENIDEAKKINEKIMEKTGSKSRKSEK